MAGLSVQVRLRSPFLRDGGTAAPRSSLPDLARPSADDPMLGTSLGAVGLPPWGAAPDAAREVAPDQRPGRPLSGGADYRPNPLRSRRRRRRARRRVVQAVTDRRGPVPLHALLVGRGVQRRAAAQAGMGGGHPHRMIPTARQRTQPSAAPSVLGNHCPGELMMPLLSSRHCWRVVGSESPLPDLVPRQVDIVRLSWGLGMAALDGMIDNGMPVGPLLCCTTHQRLLVPVAAGTASWWRAPHSEVQCGQGRLLQCSTQGPEGVCHGRRFWLLPPEPRVYATTDPQGLYDLLGRARTHLRHVALPSMQASTRTVCHA